MLGVSFQQYRLHLKTFIPQSVAPNHGEPVTEPYRNVDRFFNCGHQWPRYGPPVTL